MLVEFSMTPLGEGESVGEYVAAALDIVDRSGLVYRLTPMGTLLEGEWDEVFAVIKACHERLKADCRRISTSIKIDYRAGVEGGMAAKVESVERRLGRPLKK